MIDTVCASLQNLLRNVVSSKIGICAREIELVEVSTGKSALEKINNVAINDRFKLKIPMTDQFMFWEVIFNCSLPNCPPDFDLGDFDFYSISLESFEEAIPTLNKWDHRKDNALINVISELRSAYLKYQVDKLDVVDNRCAYEYSTLINESKMMADQVEVFIDCSTVHFLIKLDVDLSILFDSAEPQEFVLLAVRFGAHGSMRSANLMTSQKIQYLLGANLDLPHNIKGDESLVEYVEEVTRSVEIQMVTVVAENKGKRKIYIFELLRRLGHSVISYDAFEYSNCSFLLNKEGFVCIIDVRLHSKFPRQPPSYRLLSIYTASGQRPLSQVLNLPYSEKWEISTMVDNALTVVKNKKIQDFQKHTVSCFKLPQ